MLASNTDAFSREGGSLQSGPSKHRPCTRSAVALNSLGSMQLSDDTALQSECFLIAFGSAGELAQQVTREETFQSSHLHSEKGTKM